MRMPLKSLADIRVGYSFRTKIEHDPLGAVPVLRIKDVTREDGVQPGQLPRLQWSSTEPPPYLAPDDIILPARGDHYGAILAPAGPPVVASSQLFVLTVRDPNLMPEYLRWALNRPAAQSYFLTHRAGSSIPMLNKQSLGLLPVQLPSLDTQQQILALQTLWEQEHRLQQQLLVNRHKMLDGVFAKLLES